MPEDEIEGGKIIHDTLFLIVQGDFRVYLNALKFEGLPETWFTIHIGSSKDVDELVISSSNLRKLKLRLIDLKKAIDSAINMMDDYLK